MDGERLVEAVRKYEILYDITKQQLYIATAQSTSDKFLRKKIKSILT